MKYILIPVLFLLSPILSTAQELSELDELNKTLPEDQRLSQEEYNRLKDSLDQNKRSLDQASRELESINVPAIGGGALANNGGKAQGAYRLRREASRNSVDLRVREVEGLQLSEDWQNGYSKPSVGRDGRVVYHFGQTTHTIVCSVRNVCDIQLEPGERVTQAPAIGDSVQWIVTPGKTGSGENETVHIVIKPKNPGLHTSMIVFTDRRAYHFELKSTMDRHMAFVSFVYEEELDAAWTPILAAKQQVRRNSAVEVADATLFIDELDFEYRIKGRASWKPVRVFNDELKTYIQFPRSMKSGDAPVFMSIKNGKEEIMNYRLRGDTFIVDGLFKKGVLLAGVGRSQTKITITKK